MASFKHLLEYGAFRCAGFIFRALRVERASALSGKLWRFFGPKFHRQKRVLHHLALAFPEKTPQEYEIIARDMWEMLGNIFAEIFHLPTLAQPSHLDIVEEEKWRMRFKAGHGFVFCAAHQGNWEITAASLLRLDIVSAGVYQRLSNPLVEEEVKTMRSFLYPGGLYPKEAATPRRLLRYVREGGSAAFLADLRDDRGIPVPFFGQDAPSFRFPVLLAYTTNRPLISVRIVRLPGAKFQVTFEEIPLPQSGNREVDIKEGLCRLHRLFETWIREQPHQWMWSHRRWG